MAEQKSARAKTVMVNHCFWVKLAKVGHPMMLLLDRWITTEICLSTELSESCCDTLYSAFGFARSKLKNHVKIKWQSLIKKRNGIGTSCHNLSFVLKMLISAPMFNFDGASIHSEGFAHGAPPPSSLFNRIFHLLHRQWGVSVLRSPTYLKNTRNFF